MLTYVQAIVDWKQQGLVSASDVALWDYLTTLFRYTGFPLPNTAAALGAQGFIGVCDDATMPAAGCQLVAAAKTSGILIYKGALGGRFLVTGAPTPCSPIRDATNLQAWGQCVEVSIDPKPGMSFAFQKDPIARPNGGAVVQTCVAEGSPHFLFEPDPVTEQKPGKLSQLSGGSTRVSVRPAAPEVFSITPDDVLEGKGCTFAHVAQGASQGSGLLARFASNALAVFAPKVAYAGHGGLGTLPGFAEATSVFGPIDPYVFQGTFTGDVVGQQPGTPDRNRGSWSVVTLNPGDIVVRASLGDINSQLAVLNQQGGASSSKPGIQLVAQVATQSGQSSFATAGVYRVRWRSLVASSKPFGADMNVLDGTGRILATFTYANGTAAGSGPVLFNGAPVANLTWAQNVSARYEITVDLDKRTVGFGLQGEAPRVSGASYLNGAAADLARAGWQFRSQNAQTIGTDDFEILRLPDPAVNP
jgi:hypothetical protein